MALLAVAVAVVVAVVYWAIPPSGADAPAAGRAVAAGSTASAGSSALPGSSASPTASASASKRPTGRPSPSASTRAAVKPTHRASQSPSKAAGGGTGGSGTQTTVAGNERRITVVNRTQQTIWAVVTNSPAYPDGRKLQPGQSTSLTVANNWGGRIWGRTGCSTGAQGTCLTGDCTTSCSGPVTPTTLGEFTFDAFDDLDFYDVSMVDGSNLPMYINVSHTVTVDPLSASGCYKGTCTTPVNCPSAMQAKNGGQVIGCMPPCAAFGGDTYCCKGAWAGRDNCVPSKWPVDYTQVFKKAEPYAYSYAFDDSATMSCKAQCYYRITFGTTG